MKTISAFRYLTAAMLSAVMVFQSPSAAFAAESDEQEVVSEEIVTSEPETSAPETQAPPPETQAPETQAPETQAPETQAPETQAPETQAPETQAPETEPSDVPESQETEMFSEESSISSETEESIVFEDTESETETDTEPVFETETETETETILFSDTEVETAWSDILSDEDYEAVVDLLRSDTKIPVEGLPPFITQEMVSGALKVQDEKGYPASVVLAQIIVESGNGTYGCSDGKKDGLTQLAYQYHNLFALKGTGTAGTVSIQPEELNRTSPMASSDYYFRAYNTDMESIDDWAAFVEDNYGSVLKKARDADQFSKKLSACWTTDRAYYLDLRKAVSDYELERLDKLTLEQFESMLCTYVNPCPGSHISSGFGYRQFDHKVHLGLDLATGSRKIPTYAADGGTVVSAAFGHSVGNMIVIDHGNGIVTKYMHHSKMYVKAGDHVVKGQQIGLAGTTGHSTGIHLHFQIETGGKPVNPLPYLVDDMSKPIPMNDESDKGVLKMPEFDPLTDFSADLGALIMDNLQMQESE